PYTTLFRSSFPRRKEVRPEFINNKNASHTPSELRTPHLSIHIQVYKNIPIKKKFCTYCSLIPSGMCPASQVLLCRYSTSVARSFENAFFIQLPYIAYKRKFIYVC